MFLNRRENRTAIGEGINIVGALRNGGLRPEYEDDVSGLEVASLKGDSNEKTRFFKKAQILEENAAKMLYMLYI